MVCIVKSMHVSKCTVKNLTYLFIFISFGIIIHICILRNLVKFFDSVHSVITVVERSKIEGIKYVLFWDTYKFDKIHTISSKRRNAFQSLNCSVSNCEFTGDRGFLGDYSLFDAIIFNHLHLRTNIGRPSRRTQKQLYIFATKESSCMEPACEVYNDGYFNWTFTTRLDSDVVSNYFVVRNISGAIVAPSTTVKWETKRYLIDPKITAIFKGRTKAAAWIVSHCEAESLRDEYLTRLQQQLFHYSLQLDVYGDCNKVKCDNDDCEQMIRENYYFYMAFENSIVEDYVTEKVLHGYDNYVVPIVFGGANYSRFLPTGSYINARNYHPYNLAKLIHSAVTDPAVYRSYFRWTNLYTIDSDSHIYHPLCDLCEALNSEKAKHAPAKQKFRIWWNTLNGMKWCLSKEFWNETSRVNIDGKYIYNNNWY